MWLTFVFACADAQPFSLEEISVMMDLGVPTRSWNTYRVGNVEQNFGDDEFRSAAKRGKMNRGQSYHVENPTQGKEEKDA